MKPGTADFQPFPTERGVSWLPFLNAYRTMCLAPEPDFRRVLEEIRDMRLAA